MGDAIRQGLFGGEESLLVDEQEPVRQEPITEVQELIAVIAAAPPTAAELTAELVALESRGGAPYEAFQSFCETERKRYEAEMGRVSEPSRKRLLAVFDHPEKRRDLYRKWKHVRSLRFKMGDGVTYGV